MYIVVVPSPDIGGPPRIVCNDGRSLSSRDDLMATGWSDRREAAIVARRFRCGLVVEVKLGRWELSGMLR